MEGERQAIEGRTEAIRAQRPVTENHRRGQESPAPRRSPHFPLVTLALAAFQIIVYKVRPEGPRMQRCLSVATVLDDGQWSRLATASLDHANGAHLAVNLVSFVWKGMVMETVVGGPQFIPVVSKLILLVGVFNTLLALALSQLAAQPLFYTACMPTFAGVIVALKVINQRHLNCREFSYGRLQIELPPLPWSWIEVVGLHLACPGSVLPLVSGLLVGFIFRNHIVNLEESRPMPLKGPYLPSTYLLTGALLVSYFFWPSLDPCASFQRIFVQKRWQQLVFPSLYSFSSYHLTYVVLSLLSLGYQMEPWYGHYGFAFLVTCTACYVNLAHCLVAWFFSEHSGFLEPYFPPSPRDCCYSGLTGALLSLKVLLYDRNPDAEYDFASFKMAVPHWFGLLVELVHLYMYTPKAWILGHVAGVLVGLTLIYRPLGDLAMGSIGFN